jgi:hypothetical protein
MRQIPICGLECIRERLARHSIETVRRKIMIAMSLISTYDEYRRDRIAGAPVYPVPAHPFRRAMMHALGMIGVDGGRRRGARVG